jgi:hypothetical protein
MCQPAVITTTENVVGKVTAKAENLTILLSGISWPLQFPPPPPNTSPRKSNEVFKDLLIRAFLILLLPQVKPLQN